jgi:hypothetical protein
VKEALKIMFYKYTSCASSFWTFLFPFVLYNNIGPTFNEDCPSATSLIFPSKIIV